MLGELFTRYEGTCPKCGKHTIEGPLADVIHSVRCFSIRTALYNIWYRLHSGGV